MTIEDDDGVLFEKNDSKNLLVSFGGIRVGIGMPVYEFYRTLGNLECDKIFIKDVNQSWYHRGVNNDLDNLYKIAEYLQEKTKKYKSM